MVFQKRLIKNNIVVLKISRHKLFVILVVVLFFIISFSLFYFVEKQDRLRQVALAQKKFEESQKNDIYWRKLGDEIFIKLKKNVSLNKELTGAEAKNFQNDVGEALGYFKKARELNNYSYDNWLALAKFYDFLIPYVVGAENNAAESYLYIIKNFPIDFDVMRRAVRVLIINADKSYLLGKIAASNNSLKIASELSKNLSQNDPVNLYGKYYSALIARRQKDFNFATSTLEQIKPFLNKEPDLYFELGKAYLETRQFEKAKSNFEIASGMSDIYRKNSEIYLRLIQEKNKK